MTDEIEIPEDVVGDPIDVVIDDAPIVDAAAPNAKAAIITPEEGIETLRQQLADEKQAREQETTKRLAAEQRERDEANRAAKATNRAQDSDLSLLSGAIQTITQKNTMLKAELAQAHAEQNYDRVADIQVELGSNGADLRNMNLGLERLKAQPKETPQLITDPVENFVSKMEPESAAWVRAHPEYVTNERLTKRMIAAHNLAETDGIVINSPEYFAAVERTLGLTRDIQRDVQVDDNALSDAAAPAQRRSAPPAAPVSRSGSANGQRPGTIRLTAAQIEAAESSGLTLQEYAKELAKIQAEGKLH